MTGCFPAIWATCELYYPATHITFAYSAIEASIALAQILAAPLAAGLLAIDGALGGMAGWQVLFLVQGGATLAFAGVLYAYLPESVESAPWLDADDKAYIRRQHHMQATQQHGARGGSSGCTVGQGQGEVELGRMPGGHSAGSTLAAPVDERDSTQLLGRGDLSSSGGNISQPPDALGSMAVAQPPLSSLQQLTATATNPRIWYLVGVKILKVRRMCAVMIIRPPNHWWHCAFDRRRAHMQPRITPSAGPVP